MIEVEVSHSSISDIDADIVLTGVFEDKCDLENLCGGDKKLESLLGSLLLDGEINGKADTVSLIHSRGEIKPGRVLVAGLGKTSELSLDRLRCISAATGRVLRGLPCKKVGIHMGFLPRGFRYKDTSMAVIEGFLIGRYKFTKYRPELEDKKVEKFGIYFPEKVEYNEDLICRAIKTGAIIARATNFARDLCNDPANVITPVKLADIAMKLSSEYGLNIDVLDEKSMEKLDMNLLLAVARGSSEPPRLIVVNYRGAGEDDPVYGLLGKGVTFDSGGLSLKGKEAISHMHTDKAAGAIVLGLAVALSLLKARVNLTVVVPAVENMLSGNSYKPGDIFKSMAGKTVEVLNTDAEGRLIMADALTYMQRNLKIKNIIDLATLTGGSKVALGPDIIPVFSNNRNMVELFEESCWHSGEVCWEMPLYKNYLNRLESQVACLKNHSDEPPATIIAALFLSEFIEMGTDWMHLDIGGHEFRDKESLYLSYGANAIGMRSLIRYYLHLAQEDIGTDRE